MNKIEQSIAFKAGERLHKISGSLAAAAATKFGVNLHLFVTVYMHAQPSIWD